MSTLSLAPGLLVAGRYRLDRLLGQGGMGQVWAATHEVTQRTAALKFVRGTAPVHANVRRRFLREARAASAVKHPNVVQIHDFFELDDGTCVMVMDLLEGETLGQRLAREHSLSLTDALEVLLPVISATGTAHALGIVHRDLKPDNVFLAKRASGGLDVRVLDFGIAKLTTTAAAGASDRGALTDDGTMLGTPCYMSPEQSFGEKDLDHRTDIWAIGVMLYEVLAGARPVEGDNLGQIMKRLMNEGITPIEVLVPDLPAEVSALVGRMLTRDRSGRPRDLREVHDVLTRYAGVQVPAFGPAVSERVLLSDSNPATPHETPQAIVRGRETADPEGATDASGPGASGSRAAPVDTHGAQSLSVGRRSRRRTASFITGAIVLGVVVFGAARLFRQAPSRSEASAPSARASATAGVPAAPPETLFEPKPPYLTGKACTACVTANCASQNAACDADRDCAAWLADARAKPDPVSAFARYRQINTALWNAEHQHDGGPVTVPQIDLRTCARNRCTSECELGRDFSCFGKFEWPRSFPSETNIRFRFVNAQDQTKGWPNSRVRACLDAACADPLGTATTDAEGFLELTVRQQRSSVVAQYPEFNGFLQFDGPRLAGGGLTFLPLVVQNSSPWVSGDYGRRFHASAAYGAPYFKLLGKPWDPSLAYYGVQPWDCRMEPAKGVTVELRVFEGMALKRCNTCGVVYSNGANIPDLNLTAFSSLGQLAFVSGPARQSALVLRDAKTRRTVAALSLVTLPGHWHTIGLWPPSSSQLAELPQGDL